jgi:hypothetical protein
MSDSNSLELRIAFQYGRFWPISEVCQEMADLSDPLPEAILSVFAIDKRALPETDLTLSGLIGHVIAGLIAVGLAELRKALPWVRRQSPADGQRIVLFTLLSLS